MLLNNILGDPEKYNSPQELSQAIENGEIEAWWMDSKWRNPNTVDDVIEDLAQRMDSFVIQKLITTLRDKIGEDEEWLIRGLDTTDYEAYYDKMVREGAANHSDMTTFKRYIDRVENNRQLIHQLQDILVVQNSFENLFDNIVYGENDEIVNEKASLPEKVMHKYQELVEIAKKSKSEIESILSVDATLSDERLNQISNNILSEAHNFLNYYTEKQISEGDIDYEETLKILEQKNSRILLISEIVKQLPRDQVAELDLSKIPDIDKYVDLKGADLQQRSELLMQMEQIVKEQYPVGAADNFIEDCLSDKNAGLTVSVANGEVLSFFMKRNIGANLIDLDWFAANPNAPIKGLGEATVSLGFKEQSEGDEDYYAVAKPFVKSFALLIERLKFVSFGGITFDGEYVHHYARTRRLQSDAAYVSKNFTFEQNNNFIEYIKNACKEDNKTSTIEFDEQEYDVAKVVFANMDYNIDITEDDEDGWIYREIKRQSEQGKVLTRFIADSNEGNNNVFYAVFERDKSTQEERRELDIYLLSSKLAHSDSNNENNK